MQLRYMSIEEFMKTILFILISCSIIVGQTISSISSDSITHKGTLTIYGSSFGTKSPAAPLRYFNFESVSAGQSFTNEAGGGIQTAGNTTVQNDSIRFTGTQSLYQDFTSTYYGYIELTPSSLGSANKLYVSAIFKQHFGGALSRNMKYLSMGNPNGWQTRFDVYPSTSSGHLYCNQTCTGSSTLQDWGYPGDFDDNEWHRMDGYFYYGTPSGGDGYRSLYFDNSLFAELSGTFIDGDCDTFDYFLIGHYFAIDQGSPQPTLERWWDEMYIDTTQARIEIGNNSVWGSCTHREIQIPTAWSATEITVTINQGTFAAEETAYLFVVDSDGTVSSGYEIEIGGTAAGSGSNESEKKTDVSSVTEESN